MEKIELQSSNAGSAAENQQLVDEILSLRSNLADLAELTNSSNDCPELLECIEKLLPTENPTDIEVEYGERILPYLPKLMDYLFGISESGNSNRIKKLAMKSLVSITDAVYEEMLPYYPRLLSILKLGIIEKQTEEAAELQAQIFATIESIGWRLDEADILPVAEYFSKIGVEILKVSKNPILKSAVYSYFASMSYTAPEIFAKALSRVFDYFVESVKILEKIKLDQVEDVSACPETDNYFADSKDVEDKVSINHLDYLLEKKAAIEALGLLYANLKETYLPYLERSYREITKTINYPEIEIRQASLRALSEFFRVSSKLDELTENNKQMLLRESEVLVPILVSIIYKTNDVNLLASAARAYANVLTFLKSESLILNNIKDVTGKCIVDILSGTNKSQKATRTKQDDFAKYEAKEMLEHYFRSAISTEELVLFFEKLLPLFHRYLDGKLLSSPNKSFGLELISVCFRGLGHQVSKFASQLVPLLLQSVTDQELRFQAVYGITLITRYGGGAIYPYYPDIQQMLLAILDKETDDIVKDNVTSAIGGLIWSNYSILSIDEVFPIFIAHLPLVYDKAEYRAVFGGILALTKDRHAVLNGRIESLTKIAVNVLRDDSVDYKKVKELVAEFLGIVRKDYSTVWEKMGTFLSTEEVSFLQQLNFAETGKKTKH